MGGFHFKYIKVAQYTQIIGIKSINTKARCMEGYLGQSSLNAIAGNVKIYIRILVKDPLLILKWLK